MKKNIRKVPGAVAKKLKGLPRYVVAGVAKIYDISGLKRGLLKHIGVRVRRDGTLVLPEDGKVVPPAESGRYSKRNVEGEEVVRRDLPLETHYTSIDSPNWGDAATYGTHTVDLPYERYPREQIPPRLSAIKVTQAGASAGKVSLVFEVEEVLDRKARGFKDRLLECLNLLQENVGTCGVEQAGTKPGDYIASLSVSWEILPPGTKEEALRRLFRGRRPNQEERDQAAERYDLIKSLKPQSFIYGMSGVARYFGGLIRPDLVVFENLAYGNAIYVMFEDWKALSQKSRVELMSGRLADNFERVIHTKGWKKKVRSIVAERIEKEKSGAAST